MSKLAKALTAAAGNAAGESLYVEDVFSTYLYTGNGTSQTITNGIDLAGEGGMVWTKERTPNARNHFIGDSERDNFRNYLYSNLTNAQSGISASGNDISSVSSTGYTLGTNNYTWNNESGSSQVSWTFRKAEKFFDVVTYTGTGVDPMSVAHNLGVTPACVIIKRLDTTADWQVMFPGLISDGYGGTGRMRLNTTAAYSATGWTSVADSTHITIPTNLAEINASGGSYVAYLFASDAGGFGDDDESIIKCGSYAGNSAGVEVNLGFEPQWVIVKPSSISGNWDMADVMRGATAEKTATFDGNWAELTANTSSAEIARDATITPRPTGMFIKDNGLSNNGETYIYIAIRRPMKTPESGTEVFTPTFGTGSGFNFIAGFPVDMAIIKDKDNVVSHYASARLTSGTLLATDSTAAEFTNAPAVFDSQVGYYESSLGSNYIGWLFKRATGFFDVVAYTGDGVAGRAVAHNLGVAPELIIVKRRDTSANWQVYASPLGATKYLNLDLTNAETTSSARWNDTEPTSSVFTTGASGGVNNSGGTFIAYLFATLAGVSKVGSYTGNGTSQTIDCGFSGGARFILIKSTSTTGSWWVYDSARGIVAGNDPALQLNSTAAEITSADAIDPDSSGFIVNQEATCSINASGVSYIFMSIA